MINTVTIVGNLGQDPEIRYTPNAVPVASFTIAVNEVYKGKDGQKVKKTHWFRVTAFQRLAEIVGQYCTKGFKVGIRGQLQYRQWQDNGGVNHNMWRSWRRSWNSWAATTVILPPLMKPSRLPRRRTTSRFEILTTESVFHI